MHLERQLEKLLELEKLKEENTILQDKLASAQKEIKDARSSQQEFTKVSHVIMLTQENARLKNDVAFLTERVNRLLKRKPELEAEAAKPPELKQVPELEAEAEPELESEAAKPPELKQVPELEAQAEPELKQVPELKPPELKQEELKPEAEPKQETLYADPEEADSSTEPEENPEAEPPEFSVYEKKIKGKTYFVSDNDDMYIYDVLEDGSVGQQVGQLVKSDGKTKVVWI